MALQSDLFRGDSKLEAAAINDAAHIVPGASGPHVRKLQFALVGLDGAQITQNGLYDTSTSAAVLAFKKKRSIINRSYQTQADNIVGRMTMAALDAQMLAKEREPRGPILIRVLFPGPAAPLADRQQYMPGIGLPALSRGLVGDAVSGRSSLVSAIQLDPRRGGQAFPIRLGPRSTGILEIVNGNGGQVKCINTFPTSSNSSTDKSAFIYDPAERSVTTRLNPEPVGPQLQGPAFGGEVNVTKDPFPLKVDAFRPGFGIIQAFDASGPSSMTLLFAVLAPKLASVPGEQTVPLTKTRPGSKFLSEVGADPGIPGGITRGRPVNPRGGGRKINLGGEGETPGFENYTPDLRFSGYKNSQTAIFVFRPWTDDPDTTVGVGSGSASDICIRGIPITGLNLGVIKRIAGPGCRLTFSGGIAGMNTLKSAFPKPTEEFPDGEVVFDL